MIENKNKTFRLKRNAPPFLWLSNKVFKRVEDGRFKITANEIAVLCTLAYHSSGSERQEVYPSKARITKLIGIGQKAIDRALRGLIDKKIIKLISGKQEGRTNLYFLEDDR